MSVMSHRHFSLVIVTMMLVIGGITPPMTQAHSFAINVRMPNMSSTALKHQIRQKQLIQTSKTRVLYLDHGLILPPLPSGLFYVSANIGNPSLTVHLALDTVSAVTWVQSVSCLDCFNVSFPNFDPNKSTTFHLLPSNDANICTQPIAHPTYAGLACVYQAEYSWGLFGTDFFHLSPPHSSSATTPPPLITFGCAYRGFVHFDVGWDYNPIGGMLGLGRGHTTSILTQLGVDRFSYCLPRFDSQKGQPTLDFGSDAVINSPNVQKTPISSHGLYYLNLTALTLNGTVIFTMPKTDSGAKWVLLDTQTPYTGLIDDAFFSLQDAVVKYFNDTYGWKEPKPYDPENSVGGDLCYDIPANLTDVEFPKVEMQFLGGASFELSNVFEIFPEANEFCMVVMESAPNALGMYDQMGYRMLFDLPQSQLCFAPNMC